MGSGCGSVGKVVASNSRGPRFEYSLWQNLYLSFTVNCAYWRNKKIVSVVFIAGLAVVADAPVPQPDPVSEADTFFILPAPPAIIPYRPVFRTGRCSVQAGVPYRPVVTSHPGRLPWISARLEKECWCRSQTGRTEQQTFRVSFWRSKIWRNLGAGAFTY